MFDMKPMRSILAAAARLHEGASRLLVQEMAARGLGDLPASCGDILGVLFKTEGLTLAQLAARIRRTKSTASVMVERLEKLGYVEKLRSAEDARAVTLTLTEKGRGLESEVKAISEALNERICRGLSDEEADALEALLERAAANFGPEDLPEKRR